MIRTGNRPTGRHDEPERKATGKGKHVKVGLPYKIKQARETAPGGASDQQLIRVAMTALETGRDPADVWLDVVADRCAEPAGGGA